MQIFKHLSAYRLKLLIPYAVVFGLMGVVGLQITNLISAQPLTQDQVELSVTSDQYAVGAPVRFTIKNNMERPIFVANNCPEAPLQVYFWDGGHWLQQHATVEPDKCLGEPRRYEVVPHGTVSASYAYWMSLFARPGRYRLVAPIEHYQPAPSVEFTVGQ
jgi:hypothetical protein